MNFFQEKYAKYALFAIMSVLAIILYEQVQMIPKPFNAIPKIPDGQIIFLFLDDDDYTCVPGFCSCTISEAPAMPYEFNGDKLILNQYFFDPVPIDWASFRKENNSIALFGYYSQWSAYLHLFSNIPFSESDEAFSVLEANSEGDVQIKRDNKYIRISKGSFDAWTKFEVYDRHCIVLHYYTLNNFGFIQDNNVSFYQ